MSEKNKDAKPGLIAKIFKSSVRKPSHKHEVVGSTDAHSEYHAIDTAHKPAVRTKKGDASLNGCFIPTAEGHYTRMNARFSDVPKSSLTSEQAGRFVMINPTSTLKPSTTGNPATPSGSSGGKK